jgi:hypothetical protein
MRKTFLLGVTFVCGLLPFVSVAEVTLRGAYDAQPVFGQVDLGERAVSYSFDHIFGTQGSPSADVPSPALSVSSGVSVSRSASGRPLAVYSFEYSGCMESLVETSRQGGRSLGEAVAMFEQTIRTIVCGGGYHAFLEAGGSLRVMLITPETVATLDEPVTMGSKNAQLMLVEIDTIKDCEAN